MLALLRILVIALCAILGFIFTCLYSIVRPRHRDAVYHVGQMMALFRHIVGIQVEYRRPKQGTVPERAIYIANHQNSFDLVTLPIALTPGTVAIGKKSLIWIPIFGPVFWLTGNLFIDRNNRSRAAGTLNVAADKIVERNLSVWMFPEGTRSYGRGLLPFKTGAFHLARQTNEPVVPVLSSSTHGQIKLNRWNNGKVIIEIGEPVDCVSWEKDVLRSEIKALHDSMEKRIYELTMEARGEAADYQNLATSELQGEQA